MAAREKILCPECEKPSSIDLTECGNPKDHGGHCTYNTHKYWESFKPKSNVFLSLILFTLFYVFQVYSGIATVPIVSESTPLLHYMTMAAHYSPFAFLAFGLFLLLKGIRHFLKRPPQVNQ